MPAFGFVVSLCVEALVDFDGFYAMVLVFLLVLSWACQFDLSASARLGRSEGIANGRYDIKSVILIQLERMEGEGW